MVYKKYSIYWLRLFLACTILCVTNNLCYAQEEAATDTTKTKGFNALKYALQGAYKGKNEMFGKDRFIDNMYFYAGGSYEDFLQSNLNLDAGWSTSIGVGKLITPYNSVRVSFDYATNRVLLQGSLTRMGVSAAHLFNITSYILGYDPNRRLEFSTLAGGKFQLATLLEEKATGYKGFVGVQAKYHANRSLDFSLEPTIALGSRGITLAKKTDQLYNISYSVGLNARYLIHDRHFVHNPKVGLLKYGNFYSASVGAQIQTSNLEGGGIGPAASLSLGRWLLPGIGLRFTGSVSTDTWHFANYTPEMLENRKGYKMYENTSYFAGRIEGVFNPISFFKHLHEDDKFQIKVLAGGEMGYLTKVNYNQPIKRRYIGFTGGIQLGFRWDEDKLIYIEPRFTQANYSLEYENVIAFKKFSDNLLSLSMGVEIGSPIISRKKVNDSLTPFFERVVLLSLEGGANMPIQTKRYANKMYPDYQGGFLVHYLITPLHSTALHCDINRISVDEEDGYRQYNIISSAIQYRFDLTNMILGYDPERKVNVHLFAGPVASIRKSSETAILDIPSDNYGDYDNINVPKFQEPSKFFFGAETGFNVQFNISEYFGFYVAPQIRLYPTDMMPSQCGGMDKIVSAVAGFTLKLF